MNRVLIIDDEVFFVGLLAKLMTKRMWLVQTSSSAEEAIEMLDTMDFDLIVTDIFMPGLGGIEGIRILKERELAPPIIAVSGGWDEMRSEEAVMAAIKIGADAGLAKPIDKELLDQTLEDLELAPSTASSPEWPTTVNDEIDWDLIIDEPGQGLIHWVRNSSSVDLAIANALTILDYLAKHASPELNWEQYRGTFNSAVGSKGSRDLEEVQSNVESVLTAIRDDLKREEKRRSTERNLQRFDDQRERRAAAASVNQPNKSVRKRSMFAIGGVLAVAAIAAFFLLSESGHEDVRDDTRQGSLQVEKEDQETKSPNRSDSSSAFELPSDIPANVSPLLSLQAVQWDGTSLGTGASSILIAPILNVRTYILLEEICRRAPIMRDLLLLALNRLELDGTAPTRQQLVRLSDWYKAEINAYMKQPVILNVVLVTGRRLRGAEFITKPCHLLSPEEVEEMGVFPNPVP